MYCKDVEKELSALIDGELSSPAEEAVLRHVNSCGHCAVLYERLQHVDQLLEKEKIPEEIDLGDRIMEALPLNETKPVSRLGLWVATFSKNRAVKTAALILFACLLSLPFVFSPAEKSDAVENIVKETSNFLQGISRTVTDAGRGIAAAPEDVASEVKGVWLSMAGNQASGNISEMVNRTGRVIPSGVNKMTGLFGTFFDSISDKGNRVNQEGNH